MKLHEKIRFLRAFKGFNQEQMAEKLNLSPNAYSKVEQGKTDITPERLAKIADILEMTSEDIKTFEERLMLNKIEGGTNTNFVNGINLSENFEKERESYKAHITDLQKQVVSLEKQVENLYSLLRTR
ncbi:MAG: XRE family transcriptional regulator [Bacteroidetes bacterium]|nr:MAG: XRE family transcriptional regulator [Bacteroidota bacterium]